ncbi:kinesin-like motor protein 9 [Podospora fimiseda]|uniref:Kinesin-like protein n=1 Tax=Podospora fimiseda TaxID=252190 RepID=A0AAN7H2J0_9PEZI|nr:kinesin-like motor protein 9 [Podospora fimiseda]
MASSTSMSTSTSKSSQQNLFQVYLRLRPSSGSSTSGGERFLNVEEPEIDNDAPRHITLNPPNDRRRAVEKFAFTQVFEEDATQLDVFHCTGVANLVEGVLAPYGGDGTDALLATLGVTGSGKTHTILGSRTQRGMIQLALDLIFRSLGEDLLDCRSHPTLEKSISNSDPSEAIIIAAPAFIDAVYVDETHTPLLAPTSFKSSFRAPTPVLVGAFPVSPSTPGLDREVDDAHCALPIQGSPKSVRIVSREDSVAPPSPPFIPSKQRRPFPNATGAQPYQRVRGRQSPNKHFMAPTASNSKKATTKTCMQSDSEKPTPAPSSRRLARPSSFPDQPNVSALTVSSDPSSEYAIVVSMYEVYNDRIFDLLTPPTKSSATKEYRRRPLLFKPTENSPDRKVVAGLRKVICGTLQEALMVLEAGLHERRVAGTGSNSVSSRSHGFFCVEVKKRTKTTRRRHDIHWGGSTLTIVDLAGSERARDAKTAGATLAEAGKINESLMYLGQCLQMQSDAIAKEKPNLVPFRQCKLTELLFSNSFPSASSSVSSAARHRNPQKAVMVVTADPVGDYNATSQILRYSALAREVTVPRIPSISQAILSGTAPHQAQRPPSSASSVESPTLQTSSHHHHYNSRRVSPPQLLSSPPMQRSTMAPPGLHSPPADMHRTTMELAALEIARLSEELDYMRQTLEIERSAREVAESHLLSMEDKMIELEQAIREDCTAEFERRLDIEMARWRATMQVEMERGEEHWGRKIEVFERMSGMSNQILIHNDGGESSESEGDLGDEDKENVRVEGDMEEEMERLRRENEVMKRELSCLSPSKRRVQPLGERGVEIEMEMGNPNTNLRVKLEGLRVHDDHDSSMEEQHHHGLYQQGDEKTMTNGGGGGEGGGASRRKVRRLGGKRWNGGIKLDDDVEQLDDDDDDMF